MKRLALLVATAFMAIMVTACGENTDKRTTTVTTPTNQGTTTTTTETNQTGQ